jgi:hypothetical protein
MIILVSLLVALIGLLIYVLIPDGKLAELGPVWLSATSAR